MDWVYRVIVVEPEGYPDQRTRDVKYFLDRETAVIVAKRFKRIGWHVEVATAAVQDFFRDYSWELD